MQTMLVMDVSLEITLPLVIKSVMESTFCLKGEGKCWVCTIDGITIGENITIGVESVVINDMKTSNVVLEI